ncbi:MAG: DMT family transporter [Arachidicoccus sp.]|nr:DMT family transporter [Arachidicoccus sp.]
MFFGKKINPKELLYGTLTIAGIVLVYYGNMHFSAGVYIGLAAMLLSVLVSLFSKRIVNDYKPETFVLYQLTGGFIGLSLLMPVYHHLFPAENIIPQKFDWLWLLLLAWVCTIFTFVLYTDSLKSISAFTANITLTLEPVYGIILAFILYKENKDLSSVFYIGFICILLAVILQTRSITRKPQDKMLQE